MLQRFLLALLVIALIQTISSNPDRLYRVQRDPVDWTLKERAPQDQLLSLIIGVTPRNTDLLEKTLYDVSSPRSKSYGKHLSQAQLRDLIRPDPKSLQKVYDWLSASSISSSRVEPNVYDDLLQVEVTVAEAEKLLKTEYYLFQHNSNPDLVVTRCLSYSIPKEVSEVVDTVGPSLRFPQPRSLKQSGPVALLEVTTSQTPQVITPALLRQLYQIGNLTNTATNNLQAVGSFLEQYYSPSDLALFFSKIVPELNGETPTVKGLNLEQYPGIEASLDIQYIMGLGEFVNTIFWSTSGRQQGNIQNEPFLEFLYNLGNDTNPPLVVSISYDDSEDSVEYDYAVRVNLEFQKAGARGISVLTASGDGGVSGPQFTNNCTIFDPTFPAASPYVTAVGGTVGGFSGPEIAANLTAGGFSNRWARPSYQAQFVENYFNVAQNLPNPGLYNHTGAGFPDVSAQSVYFEVALKGKFILVDGTSCATPTVASIISLLNGVRLNAGKSSLGYLNNLFYDNPQAFNDITDGLNPGCNTNGFSAAVGWDPLTGLGTPNFPALLEIIQALP